MAKRKLKNAVVVLTGASSGIGRAAALQFARKGANLVLAARRADELERLAAECDAAGVQALAVPTDVSDAAAVEALAARAVETFGRIDVWVNNAGVYAMGRFEELPLAVLQRTVEVDLLGVVYGMRAALVVFQQQGHGTIVNTASLAGKAPYAFASMYAATKAAVRALTEAVDQEQLGRDIHVAALSPASVDTPLFDHAANYTGHALRAMPPVYDVERVAHKLVALAERPRQDVSVGLMPILSGLVRTFVRPLHEWLMPRQVLRGHLGRSGAPERPGNLFQPTGPGGASGGWKRFRPAAAIGALAAAGGLAVMARRRMAT